MEPEGLLPHSQVPTTCPYPEPARSSPYSHIPLPEDPSLYYSPPPIISSSESHVPFHCLGCTKEKSRSEAPVYVS